MKVSRIALLPLYKALELPAVYSLNRRIGRPTTDRFRQAIIDNLSLGSGAHVLELGCGLGDFRDFFGTAYTGIDLNPAYIKKANSRSPGEFVTMDCTELAFSDEFFDEVVSIATMHHLDDNQVIRTVKEALRVCRPSGYFHVIDAILPISPNFRFKTIFFSLDRGRFPRKLDNLITLLSRAGNVIHHAVLTGPLHDVTYIRISRKDFT